MNVTLAPWAIALLVFASGCNDDDRMRSIEGRLSDLEEELSGIRHDLDYNSGRIEELESDLHPSPERTKELENATRWMMGLSGKASECVNDHSGKVRSDSCEKLRNFLRFAPGDPFPSHAITEKGRALRPAGEAFFREWYCEPSSPMRRELGNPPTYPKVKCQ